MYTKSLCFTLFFWINLIVFSEAQAADEPLLRHTIYGDVAGLEVESAIEDEAIQTYAWLGIPFAKPPVDELRWRAPQPLEPWQGVKECKAFSEAPAQFGGLMAMADCEVVGDVVGSEDCLYLNVWRPRTQEENLPVFFWIYGGANCVGQTAMSIYNGANFAGKSNFIVVSINYRVGPLGWFHHPALDNGDPKDASGNYGTLDIIQGLEWVRDNIAAFGGDPNNVTIAGESAGGVNVFTMLASPLAEGLFHRAISQSGAPFSSAPEKADKETEAVLLTLLQNECLAKTEDEARTFLKAKDKAWIANYLRTKSTKDFMAAFTPGPLGVVRGSSNVFHDGHVIPMSPFSAMRKGIYNKVPILMGSNAEEIKLFLPFVMSEMSEAEICHLMKETDPNAPNFHLADNLKRWKWPIYQGLGFFSGLSFQWAGVNLPAHYMRQHQDEVYSYRFTWDNLPKPFDFFIGAGHALEIPFVFGNFQKDGGSVLRFAWSDANKSGRVALSKTMMSCWAEFARTGKIAQDINVTGFQEFAVQDSSQWWRSVWALGLVIAAIIFCSVKLTLLFMKNFTMPIKLIAFAAAALAVLLCVGLPFMTLGVAVFITTCLCVYVTVLPNVALWNRAEAKTLAALGMTLSKTGAILLLLGAFLDTRNVNYWGLTLGVLAFAVTVAVLAVMLLMLGWLQGNKLVEMA